MSTIFNVKDNYEKAIDLLTHSDLIIDAPHIEKAIDHLAEAITEKFSDRYPIICCIMTGGIVMTGQLLVRLNFPLDVDYIDVSRYGDLDVGGQLVWRSHPKIDFTNRTVILVDDILDCGQTLAEVKATLLKDGAEAVYTAVLSEKELDCQKPIVADFVGLRLPNRFVFGYGMDAYGYWRNLPGIYAVGDKKDCEC